MISRRLLPFSEDNSYSFIHSSTNLKYLKSYKEATSSGFLAQQVPASNFSFISWGVFLSPLHSTFSQEIIGKKPHTDSILMHNLTHLREKYPRKGRHCIPVDCWSQKHASLEGWRFSVEGGHPHCESPPRAVSRSARCSWYSRKQILPFSHVTMTYPCSLHLPGLPGPVQGPRQSRRTDSMPLLGKFIISITEAKEMAFSQWRIHSVNPHGVQTWRKACWKLKAGLTKNAQGMDSVSRRCLRASCTTRYSGIGTALHRAGA